MKIINGNIVASVAAVKAAERAAIENGVSEAMLIENAAAGLKKTVDRLNVKRVAVVYGGGNNGADGLTLARHLATDGYDVTLVQAFEPDKADKNAAWLRAALYCGAKRGDIDDLKDVELIVDAIFGTGLNRQTQGRAKQCIEAINRSPAKTLAVDVPSGIDADTGETFGAVHADLTVTFACVKRGLIASDAIEHVGEIMLTPIGLKNIEAVGTLTDASLLPPPRKKTAYKNLLGRVYVIGGSRRMTGAPALTATAAIKAGAGLVTIVCPEYPVTYGINSAMFMRLPLPDRDGFAAFDEQAFSEIAEYADTVVIGNGMGACLDLGRMLRYLAEHFCGTLVVDADGLNALARDPHALDGHRCKVLFTPHLGELKRLAGEGDTVERADRVAKQFGAVVAAKSAVTVITDGKTRYFNAAGSPALAKGGSGDMLAGIAAAYACRVEPLRALAAACYKLGSVAETYFSSDEDGLTAQAATENLKD